MRHGFRPTSRTTTPPSIEINGFANYGIAKALPTVWLLMSDLHGKREAMMVGVWEAMMVGVWEAMMKPALRFAAW